MQAGGASAAAAHSPKNALLVAFSFTLPYHVMRTAAAAGLRVHVLGGGAARGLKRSRYCRAYHETRSAGDAEALLSEIGAQARRYAIDVILPSDDVSTRLLAMLGDRLPVRATPLPRVATFELLYDKWRFTRFCRDNGVRAPDGWLFDSVGALRNALEGGEIALPITVKPVNRSGGVGVLHIREPGELRLIEAIDYRPILAQRHVFGEEASITVFCDHGRVTAHVAQQRDSRRFRVFADGDLLATVSRLVALTGYHGIANFDAVIAEADGLGYLVECNPRFWYSVYLVMIAGLNFVELALAPAAFAQPATIASGEFRLSLRRLLTRPWRANRRDWKFLAYCFGDPIPFALQRAGSYDDSEIAVAGDTWLPASPCRGRSRPGSR
jgi:biotin carboxylase